MTLMMHATTLYNTHELAHTTHLATHADVMADKLAKEGICSERISYLQRIKGLPSLAAKPIMRCLLTYLLALNNRNKYIAGA